MPIPIHDAADPRIAGYTGLRDAHAREQHLTVADATPEDFIAEGELVVRHLIGSELLVRSVLMTLTRLAAMSDALAGLDPAVPIYVAEQPVLNAIAGFNIHRGVLAVGQRPRAPELAALLASASALVILEDLSNHDNIGGIFRATSALAGGAAVLLSPRCADPFYRKAIRVSMGTIFRTPMARLEPWPQVLAQVREAGFTLVALTPDPSATPINSVTVPAKAALLLGAEGPGLAPATLAAADLRVRITIDPGVDSLNVVVAAGIALHRLCRL